MSDKKSTWMIKILIILIAISPGLGNLLVANLSMLSQVYSDVPENIIVMANTLPYLTAIPTCLLCAVICRKWGNKTVTLLSLLLLGIGGALPLIISDFTVVLISRAIFGLGWGILMTVPLSLVAEYLPMSEQAGFIGVVMAVISLGASVFTMMGGMLGGNIKWIWLAHLLALVFFVPIALFFPKDVKNNSSHVSDEQVPGKKTKTRIPMAFFVMLILNLVLSGVAVCGQNLTSFFVEEKGLGGAAMAGTLISIFQIAAFAGGFLTGPCVKKMRKYTVVICCALTAVGYIVFASGTSVATLIVGSIIFGVSGSVVNALMFVHNAWVVPIESNDIVTGITQGGLFGAGFFLVYIPSLVCQFLGYGSDYTVQFIIVGVTYLLVAVAYAVLFNVKGVKESVDKVLAESYDTNTME